jgi:DNA-directed RNA polymerase subunit RPC12/RpoP
MIERLQCEFCRHVFEIMVETRLVKCPACGKDSRVMSAPRAAVPPPPPPAPSPVNLNPEIIKPSDLVDKLEMVGSTYFVGSLILGGITILCALIEAGQKSDFDSFPFFIGLLITAAIIGQGFVIDTLFKGAAEVIRLLSKLSAP